MTNHEPPAQSMRQCSGVRPGQLKQEISAVEAAIASLRAEGAKMAEELEAGWCRMEVPLRQSADKVWVDFLPFWAFLTPRTIVERGAGVQ